MDHSLSGMLYLRNVRRIEAYYYNAVSDCPREANIFRFAEENRVQLLQSLDDKCLSVV